MTEETPASVRALRCQPCLADGREHFRLPESYARRVERESGYSMRAVPCPHTKGSWHIEPASQPRPRKQQRRCSCPGAR